VSISFIMRRRHNSVWTAALCAAAAAGCTGDAPTTAGPDGGLASYRLVPVAGDSLHGYAGEPVNGAQVLVRRRSGEPVSGVPVWWRLEAGSGSLARIESATNDSGVAAVEWILDPRLWVPQYLWVGFPGGDSIQLRATAALPSVVVLAADSGLIAVDSIGARIPVPAWLLVLLPGGRPVSGALVEFRVSAGGGRVKPLQAYTDSAGMITANWQLGDSSGVQNLTALVRRRTGEVISTHLFRAQAVPGSPASLIVLRDTIRFHSLQDTVASVVAVFDRAGNLLTTPCYWSSLSPGVIQGAGLAGLVSLDNGTGMARVQCAALSALLPVVVTQVPVAVRADQDSVLLNWIGATSSLSATAVDARGVEVSGSSVGWRVDTGLFAQVDPAGLVRAAAPGTALAIASYQGLADTVTVVVDQVPASITVVPETDTMDLGGTSRPTVVVADSSGTLIPAPALQLQFSDSGVIQVLPSGDHVALLPGMTTVNYQAGPAATTVTRVVEGVAITAAGQRVVSIGALPDTVPFTITNGRIRVSWSTAMWEIASVEMDVRLGNTWQPANARHWGDWVYIASSVRTLPTAMRVIENTMDRVGLEMRFDDHWFLPQAVGLPDTLVDQPYPFVRTLWLRKGDNGYYSWVDLFSDLQLNIVEHETGFGGLWGPATIRTNTVSLRTDTLSQTTTYNGNPGLPVTGSLVDAAEFLLDQDPVRRVIVPLPEAPFITPVFPGWGYGSIYRYASPSRSFGVYMYATGMGAGPDVPTICQGAWSNAPFPLHSVSASEFASCGPTSP
jgi:hypothetical protein